MITNPVIDNYQTWITGSLGCYMGVESLTWYIAWMQEYLIASSIASSVVTRRTS